MQVYEVRICPIIYNTNFIWLSYSIRRRDNISIAAVHRRHIEGLQGTLPLRTFLNWVASGSKYAAIAQGGEYLNLFQTDLQSKLSISNRIDRYHIHACNHCVRRPEIYTIKINWRFCLANI